MVAELAVDHRLVKATAVKSPDGPNRKHYQLTEAGRRTLDQMKGYRIALKRQADSVVDNGC